MGEFNQAKYIQQYQKEKYDRCIFNLPKGQKKNLEKHYKERGFNSLNQYINELIRQDMNENKDSTKNINIGKIGDKNKIQF